jgi:hypothetical protein
VAVCANRGGSSWKALCSPFFETVKPSFHDKNSVFFTKLGA